jgi:hypothetical protein
VSYEFIPDPPRFRGQQWVRVEGPGLPDVEVRVRVGLSDDGRLACTGLLIGGNRPSLEIGAAQLRHIPLGAIVASAADFWNGSELQDPLGSAILRHMARKTLGVEPFVAGVRTRPGRAGLPAEHWEKVAMDYQAALAAAPDRPILHLVEATGTPEPTWRRWVRIARDKGLLGEARPGKAGEFGKAGEQ